MSKEHFRKFEDFAFDISRILKTDRWVFLVCTGEMGSGKSCFTTKAGKLVSKNTGTSFSFRNNVTFLRKELQKWLDGEGEAKTGRKPEFSSIIPDELISMFFKRNWYDVSQIDGIELLNKCRDRHQFIAGNIPSFWDLDSALFSIVTFWVHIPVRGVAWVFEPDVNPFVKDKWHMKENEKLFSKYGNPYKCKNFLYEIYFDDWSPQEKVEYYEMRNVKRLNTEGQRTNVEKYGFIKSQRDNLISWVLNKDFMSVGDMAKLVGLSEAHLKDIKNGEKYYKKKKKKKNLNTSK